MLDQFVVEDKVIYFIKEKVDGILHYNLVVPQSLKQKALEFAHTVSGHFGQKKTIAKAEEFFNWANLNSETSQYVKNYITCQQFKGTTGLQQKWQELPSV